MLPFGEPHQGTGRRLGANGPHAQPAERRNHVPHVVLPASNHPRYGELVDATPTQIDDQIVGREVRRTERVLQLGFRRAALARRTDHDGQPEGRGGHLADHNVVLAQVQPDGRADCDFADCDFVDQGSHGITRPSHGPNKSGRPRTFGRPTPPCSIGIRSHYGGVGSTQVPDKGLMSAFAPCKMVLPRSKPFWVKITVYPP